MVVALGWLAFRGKYSSASGAIEIRMFTYVLSRSAGLSLAPLCLPFASLVAPVGSVRLQHLFGPSMHLISCDQILSL